MPKGPDIPVDQLEAMVRERIRDGWLPVTIGRSVKAGFRVRQASSCPRYHFGSIG